MSFVRSWKFQMVLANVLLGTTFLSLASAGENPILTTVKATVKDPSKPFTMVVTVQVKEGAGEKFEAAFAKAIKGTREEKGCIAYDLNRDSKTAGRYMVYERWRNVSALADHLKTPHITALLGELGDLAADGGNGCALGQLGLLFLGLGDQGF